MASGSGMGRWAQLLMSPVLGVSLWGNGKLLKSDDDDDVGTTVYAPNLWNCSLKKGRFYGM